MLSANFAYFCLIDWQRCQSALSMLTRSK